MCLKVFEDILAGYSWDCEINSNIIQVLPVSDGTLIRFISRRLDGT